MGAILERFWAQVGGQVGAKLASKSAKMELQDDVKQKHQKKEAMKSGRGGLKAESSPKVPGVGGAPKPLAKAKGNYLTMKF